jgi:3-oxoacyl-[acyl-carrier protein] reductase
MFLENRVALVTGAAKGIGAQCAMTLAKHGAAVIAVDTDEESGRKTVEKISTYSRCVFVKADVSSEADADSVFNFIDKEYGRLDILVNVAGICSTNTIFKETVQGWDKIMDVNVKGTFLFSRKAFPMMISRKHGRIINMSSISGQVGGIRTSPAYAVSKSGVLCLTKSFAKLGAKENITVNAVSPGLIDTEMTRNPNFQFSVAEIPMGRVGDPQEVADTVLFLASGMSSYITGQCINVNGGMYMG